MAQVINSIAKAYDKRKLNDMLEEAGKLLEEQMEVKSVTDENAIKCPMYGCERVYKGVSDMLVKEKFSGICAEAAHTGFYTTKMPDYHPQIPFFLCFC